MIPMKRSIFWNELKVVLLIFGIWAMAIGLVFLVINYKFLYPAMYCCRCTVEDMFANESELIERLEILRTLDINKSYILKIPDDLP